jgi:hypothetical protein
VTKIRLSNRLMLVVVLVACAALLAACAGGVPTPGPTAGSTGAAPAPAASGGAAAAPKPLNLAIGQSADYSGVSITLVSAGKGPKDFNGKPTYKLSVKYKNGGAESLSFNEFDWKLEDASGARTQDTAMLTSSPKTLGTGDIAPGGSTSGDIYFTPGASVAKIVYQPSMFSGEENLATWKAK